MSDSLVRVSRRVEWGTHRPASGARSCRSMPEVRAACYNQGYGIPRAYRVPGLWPPPQSTLVHAPSRSAYRLIVVPHSIGAHRRPPSASLPIISSTLRLSFQCPFHLTLAGPGTTGLSPSPVPPLRGLGPGLPLRTLLQTTIRTTELPDSKAGLFPIRSPLLRESLQTCPRPNGFGRNLHSKTRWFTGFCNSHQVLYFAMFFIDARAEIFVAESRFHFTEEAQSTGQKSHCVSIRWDHRNALFYLNNRFPLVHTSSELAVRCAGKAPEGTIPSPSPDRHAATLSRRGSSSNSPPIADGFGTGTPCPALRANPFPEVTDPFCRLPLPTLFHRPEVVHLGDLMRL
ncbi:hypothetical protein CQW23_32493 [Capsicum baccatum]|uniref:Protein TAR1 n=1 Tax=Capsicum baccatum TaxID=33114 RepID=A0A2G2V4K0_CAPBA|nr:hypothetical protein CQW23_32493 [Capsicum baccatum]